ncbi:DUF5988 family protein [Actinomadura chibensis]|uniref:Uncharacterized protein n=1 Tax=Actinomadura chibensis TaxID=392828 RepID=A0A5D0NBL5_9ACTN|nr:DUF5988 family protein [Actinomadura chibensis]TYB41840.1 hypothetical protein FXF69_33440 [Actinomadura chibensis]
MEHSTKPLVDVLLEGGPDTFSAADRRRRIPAGEPTVKVSRGHCTEHFFQTRRVVRIEDGEFQIYHWSHRTYVAE